MATDILSDDLHNLENCRIRVLHFIPGSSNDEIPMIFAKRQASSLVALGFHASYAYFEDRHSLIGIWKGYRCLLAAIKKESPDIVHAHFGTITGLIGAFAKSKPLVITYRGSDLNPDPTNSALGSFIKRCASQIASLRADQVIVVSEELKSRLWWRKRRAIVIPSGVDIDAFRPIDLQQARVKLKWPMDEYVVLFNAGKNPVNKRLDLAEQAVLEVQAIFPMTRLIVLAADVAPAMVPTIMCASDCLLMLSDNEGSPNVVKEAMACNLPVISFEVGDVKGLIDGVDGCELVDRDMRALIDALRRAIQVRTRSNGRDKIEKFAIKNVAKEVAKLYSELICAR